MAKRSPNLRIKVMNYLGQCYDRMGMTDLAAGQFKEAIAELTGMDETKKELLYNVALLFEKLGNQADYLDALKQIYAVDYGYRDVAEGSSVPTAAEKPAGFPWRGCGEAGA